MRYLWPHFTYFREAKMGPWDNEEVVHLIDLYRQQIDEFGDDHIDFQVWI